MTVLLISLVCLTTFRVTHLVARDSFPPILKFRMWVRKKFGETHWATYLTTCMWCISVYVGGGVTLVTWLVWDLPYALLVWPTASAITGLLALVESMINGAVKRLDRVTVSDANSGPKRAPVNIQLPREVYFGSDQLVEYDAKREAFDKSIKQLDSKDTNRTKRA